MSRSAPSHVNRRLFLGSSAAAYLASKSMAEAAAEMHWDLIVVGAGTAGLPAAIFAARRGAKVLLLEAASKLGGTLSIAGGEISAARTKTQARFGVTNDHPDIHFDDVMRMSNGLADPDLVRLTVDNAGAMVDWIDDHGWQCRDGHFLDVGSEGRLAYSVRRYYQSDGAGLDITKVFLAELEKDVFSGNVKVHTDARVTELLTSDNGTVEGVRADMNGEPFTARGRHVLVTSGGYVMNPDMFQKLVNQPLYIAESFEFALGDGLSLAANVGAALRGANLHRPGSGSILTGYNFPSKVYARFDTRPQKRMPWEIWVNDDGQRYVNEQTPGRSAREQELLKQPRLRYSIIFDDEIFNAASPGIPDWSRDKMAKHFNGHVMFHKADTIEDLAAKAELNPANLAQTIATYNSGVTTGAADPFGREHRPLAIAKAPYYAIVQLGHSATSSVGVNVNSDLQAITNTGEPIKGLYAAGEVLGSGAVLGNSFIPGMMITPAMTFGRHLGLTLEI
ncbi:MAG: FAD-dependent oxidoreductase [Alphaproteobacteria bacterium]|nr:FAD-dependent oxidoreductase [Alphaproteobacteria bacterium]